MFETCVIIAPEILQANMSEPINEYITGCLTFIHPNGYGFFKPDSGEKQFLISAKLINEHELNVGDIISVEMGEYYSIKHKNKGLCVKKIME